MPFGVNPFGKDPFAGGAATESGGAAAFLSLPFLARTPTIFPPSVSGGALPALPPPTVTQWKDPFGRYVWPFGLRLYGVRLGVGDIPAGGTGTVAVPIPGLTRRQAWIVGAGVLEAGVYIRNAKLTRPGELTVVYVNRTGGTIYQSMHEISVLVMARSLPLS